MKSIQTLFIIMLMYNLGLSQVYKGDKNDISIILKNAQNFSKYVMASDYDMIGKSYTKDAKIFPSKSKIIEGTESIVKYWELPEDVQIKYHKIEPSEITIVDDTAYDYGYYEGKTKKSNDKEISWKGKYVIVWKKIGDDWKMYLDIWNGI